MSQSGARIVVRALEDAALKFERARGGRVTDGSGAVLAAGRAEAEIYIYPGHRFRVVDQLLTNFHLPRSSLLVMVSAFAGRELLLAAYRHAIEQRYRHAERCRVERFRLDWP